MSATVVSTHRPLLIRLVPAALGLLLVAAIAAGASLVLADANLRADIERAVASPLGLLALFAFSALSSATLLLPVPGMALTVLAATVVDPLTVGILAGAGQATGELTGYLAGMSGNALVGQRLSGSRLAGWMRRYGTPTIFFLALVPNPLFDVAGMLAGSLRMPVLPYLTAAGAGKIIRNTVLAFATVHAGLLIGGVPS
jgi:membrane protein YqaA with SNARE-associated domain